MKIRLVVLGDKMPAWVDSAVDTYASRLRAQYALEIKQIALQKRTKNNIDRVLNKELAMLQAAISDDEYVVALEVDGKLYDTPGFAQRVSFWQDQARPVCVVVGGPEGLHRDFAVRVDETLSLSKLTLPHPLARVVVLEQLYRAWSILNNHPYHRE